MAQIFSLLANVRESFSMRTKATERLLFHLLIRPFSRISLVFRFRGDSVARMLAGKLAISKHVCL